MWGDRVEIESDWRAKTATYSNREYLVFETMAVRIDDPGGTWSTKEAVTLKLYVDCTNGTVVYDVAEYEKSLGLEPEVREEWY